MVSICSQFSSIIGVRVDMKRWYSLVVRSMSWCNRLSAITRVLQDTCPIIVVVFASLMLTLVYFVPCFRTYPRNSKCIYVSIVYRNLQVSFSFRTRFDAANSALKYRVCAVQAVSTYLSAVGH